MSRDNNLGMWTRGPNDGGVYISNSNLGPEYTDDMSLSTMPLPPSIILTLASVFVTLLCLLAHAIPLTIVL